MMHSEPIGWFVKNNTHIDVFYKNISTGIILYQIDMVPVRGKSPYSPLRTMAINYIRKNSGLGARINQDALEGYRGSAAMIDYVVRFPGHLNGSFDKKFMFGGTDAVRSRVKIVQDELYKIASESFRKKGSFRLFELGPGYLRTQIDLISRCREAGFDIEKGLKIVGADQHPEVVKAARRIIDYESIAKMVEIHQGDAKDFLKTGNDKFDAILAEGVFEYCDMPGSLELGKALHSALQQGGYLIASATHVVPKKRLIEYLDILVISRSNEDFVRIFHECGFEGPTLLQTEPANISVGIGRRR